MNELCDRDKDVTALPSFADIFVETGSDDFLEALEAAAPLSPPVAVTNCNYTPKTVAELEVAQHDSQRRSPASNSPAPSRPPRVPDVGRGKLAAHGNGGGAGLEQGDGGGRCVDFLRSQGYARLGLPWNGIQQQNEEEEQEKKIPEDCLLHESCEAKKASVRLLQQRIIAKDEERKQNTIAVADVRDLKDEVAASPDNEGEKSIFFRPAAQDEQSRRTQQSPLGQDEYMASADTSCASADSPERFMGSRTSAECNRSSASGGRCRAMPVLAAAQNGDVSEVVGAQHGEHTELLVLLRALLNKKNAEISTLTSSLNTARTSSDSLQRDLSATKQGVAHVSSALRLEEGQVAHLRLAMHLRDKALQRQSCESSTRCAQLLERVATLEAHNASLRQLYRDHAVKNQAEQNLLNEKVKDSLRREASLEGQRMAAQREKELLLSNATARLQSQEQRVREYQQQLETALSDKIRIQRQMAQCVDVCDGASSGGAVGRVHSRSQERQACAQQTACSFTHYLPPAMHALSAPVTRASIADAQDVRGSDRKSVV